jgi:hypothetical protein
MPVRVQNLKKFLNFLKKYYVGKTLYIWVLQGASAKISIKP